jgi:bacteriocin biosynthesis cyclodehydratase domain-containing protein
MISRPKLKSFLTVFPISETTWGVRGGSDELWRLKLGHKEAMRTFAALLPYLTGRHSTDEIFAELESQGIAPGAVRAILERLVRASFLEEGREVLLSAREAATFRDQIVLFSRFTNEGGEKYQHALLASRVAVWGDGRFSASLERQLAAAGFGHIVRLVADPAAGREGAAEGGLTVVETLASVPETVWPQEVAVPDLLFVPQQEHDPTLLEAVDAFSRHRRVPWMLVRALDFREGWVGPLFIPGETASYRSLDARLRGNMPFYEESQAYDRKVRSSGKAADTLGGLHAFFELLAAVAVIEAVKLVSGIRVPELMGKFLTLDPWRWEIETHEVLRVPWIDQGLTAPPATFPWKEGIEDDREANVD